MTHDKQTATPRLSHPNLSDEINRNIAKSEIEGGCWINILDPGKTLLIQTKNTLYRLEKRGEKDFWISGHPKYCPDPTKATIHGSTFGGSMLKIAWVGRGMHLEFSIPDHGTITTSEIQEITEAA